MADRSEDRLYDKRLVSRFITSGAVDPKDLAKRLKSLPDLADQAEPVDVALSSVDDED